MTESNQISEAALQAAYTDLSDLAEAEYGQNLAELLADDHPVQGGEYANFEVRDSHDAFWRLGRLIGITVKEPFAKPENRTEQESQTDARRVWNLDEKALNVKHPDLWQYNLLTEFLADTDRVGYFDWLPPQDLAEANQVARFLEEAHSERGVFGALVRAARPYLCKDPEVREKLTKTLARGRIDADPAQMIAGGATTGAATLIIAVVPWLGPAALPVVAGMILIITAKGLDALCSRTVPSPTGDIVET